MFFEGDRIKAMREMIIADNTEDRKKALDKIMPYQQGDFEALFEEMNGYPVTIRFWTRRSMSSSRPRKRTSRRSPRS